MGAAKRGYRQTDKYYLGLAFYFYILRVKYVAPRDPEVPIDLSPLFMFDLKEDDSILDYAVKTDKSITE